jgi:hypothetical protein
MIPESNPNESKKYMVIHATAWSKGDKIEQKNRLVVIEYTPKPKYGGYAVRWQLQNKATFGGASYNSEEAAHNAFLRKYLDHNKDYPKGNPSYLPGLVS